MCINTFVYIGPVQDLLNAAIECNENCPLCEVPMAPNMIKLMKTTFVSTASKVNIVESLLI